MRRARKTAITLMFDTQSSRADAIPPNIVELVKLNACFAVKSWRSNDGFLGDGSFQAGIRATELRMGKDVGTSILTGATAERFEIVKWFYIEADDDTGYDAAADIIARAMENLHPAIGGPIVHDQPDPAAAAVTRDLLDDIAAVLDVARRDAPKVPAADIPARLRTLAPEWAPYRTINGPQIRRYLEAEHGIKVPTTGRRYPVDPAAIRDAIVRRDAAADPDGAAGEAGEPTRPPARRIGTPPGPTGVSAAGPTVARPPIPGVLTRAQHRPHSSLSTSLPLIRALAVAPHSEMKMFTRPDRPHCLTHSARTPATTRPATPRRPHEGSRRTSAGGAARTAECRCRGCRCRRHGPRCTAP
jgi:hypothetical protein